MHVSAFKQQQKICLYLLSKKEIFWSISCIAEVINKSLFCLIFVHCCVVLLYFFVFLALAGMKWCDLMNKFLLFESQNNILLHVLRNGETDFMKGFSLTLIMSPYVLINKKSISMSKAEKNMVLKSVFFQHHGARQSITRCPKKIHRVTLIEMNLWLFGFDFVCHILQSRY